MEKPDLKKALATWTDLNAVILTADEQLCQLLMKEELKTKRRKQFLLRIHSRFNRVRADRERRELRAKLA